MSDGAPAQDPAHPGAADDVAPQLYAGRLRIVLRDGDLVAGILLLQLTSDKDHVDVTWRPVTHEPDAQTVRWPVRLDRSAWARWLRTDHSGPQAVLVTGPLTWQRADLQVEIDGRCYGLPTVALPSLLRLSVM